MKSTVYSTSLCSALALTLVAVAQFTGLVSLPGLTPTALVSGLAAAGVVAFACSDYSRKPSFGNRRTSARATQPALVTPCSLENAETDWTYIARSA